MRNAIKDQAKKILKAQLEDGYQLRDGQTRKSAVEALVAAIEADLADYVDLAVEQATEKATRDWYDNDLYCGEIDYDRTAMAIFWNAEWYTDESETELTEFAKVYEAKRVAEATARRERHVAELAELIGAMEPGTRYRYNAPLFESVGYRATQFINELLANGSIVKIERTASNPPYLMLAK